MAKRISKRVREEAALICSAKACDWSIRDASLIAIGEYSHNEEAVELARLAFFAAPGAGLWGNERFVSEWAEAECLLRCGWSP